MWEIQKKVLGKDPGEDESGEGECGFFWVAGRGKKKP